MNLVLFEPREIGLPLPAGDPRARHVLTVLRRREGEAFDAGVVNGPLGKAVVTTASEAGFAFDFQATAAPPPSPRIALLVGLPRPQTARDILRDATTLGATCIHFVLTERGDPNYASSGLWTSGEWRRHCLAGAAQAFDTRLPEVTWTHTLASAIDTVGATTVTHATDATSPADTTGIGQGKPNRIALDNYEASIPLGQCHLLSDKWAEAADGLVVAFGPERGWGAGDREALRGAGFTLAHLGTRVLRLETAVVAALAVIQSRA